MARYFFLQLLDGIQYCYKKGIAHRDLKPENLLFDEKFNLKIADFGHSQFLKKYEDGKLRTVAGTPSYMAPEMHLLKQEIIKEYDGLTIDLFSAGMSLFAMRCLQLPLYKAATKTDIIYKFICQKDYDSFWDHFESNFYGKGFFSDNFKDLLTRMLAYDAKERLSLK